MTAKRFLLILLFLVSEGVGIACGEWFFRLYVSSIPPVGQNAFTANASHAAHLLYGAVVGLLLFLWALLGMLLGRAQRPSATPPPGPAA